MTRSWLDDLRDLASELEPGLYVSEVQHDDNCPLLLGAGVCCCNPNIIITRFDQKDEPRVTRPEVTP